MKNKEHHLKLKVGPIQIFVSDIEKAKEWYSNVLEMKLVQEYPDFKCILMKLGSYKFDIGIPNKEWGEGWDRVRVGGRTSIFFETDDIFKTVQELKDKGVKFVEEPSKRPWGEYKAVFADPDGNEFNLTQPE